MVDPREQVAHTAREAALLREQINERLKVWIGYHFLLPHDPLHQREPSQPKTKCTENIAPYQEQNDQVYRRIPGWRV